MSHESPSRLACEAKYGEDAEAIASLLRRGKHRSVMIRSPSAQRPPSPHIFKRRCSRFEANDFTNGMPVDRRRACLRWCVIATANDERVKALVYVAAYSPAESQSL